MRLPDIFHRRPSVMLGAALAPFALWSMIGPHDLGVWAFEFSPAAIGLIILLATEKRFRFSPLVYGLLFLHGLVLIIAAKYTYARMPLFDWLKEVFSLSRNHFDRVGHFFQGFVPALIAREVLLGTTDLKRGKMLGFLCIAVCLAISAFWELLEWWVVLFFYPTAGPEWLGMQGDIWDAQSDMLMCLIGSSLSILFLSGSQDRSMESLPREG